MDKKIIGISRDLIIHPGETLAEVLESRGMTQKELAVRTDVSEKHVSNIIKGKANISNRYSIKLEIALGIPARFWSNLQANYDRELLEYEEQHNISADELNVAKNLKGVIKYFVSKRLLDESCESELSIAVLELRKLGNVADLMKIPEIPCCAAFRVNKKYHIDPYTTYFWRVFCEKVSENRVVSQKFSKEKLRASLSDIKNCMFLPAEEMRRKLTEIFSNCGVAFSIVKNFQGAPVQGFIQHKEDGTAILCMTIRGKAVDIFWFTLFHEIGHLLHGDGREFVDFSERDNESEKLADQFAQNELLDQHQYEMFVSKHDFSLASIESFAQGQRVIRDIVIGRLEKEEYIDYAHFARIKVKFEWIH